MKTILKAIIILFITLISAFVTCWGNIIFSPLVSSESILFWIWFIEIWSIFLYCIFRYATVIEELKVLITHKRIPRIIGSLILLWIIIILIASVVVLHKNDTTNFLLYLSCLWFLLIFSIFYYHRKYRNFPYTGLEIFIIILLIYMVMGYPMIYYIDGL